MTHSFLL